MSHEKESIALERWQVEMLRQALETQARVFDENVKVEMAFYYTSLPEAALVFVQDHQRSAKDCRELGRLVEAAEEVRLG